MAFQVPYAQLKENPPVHNGFQQPPVVRKRKSNWWGLGGFLLSMAGLITCGFFSPIALFVSLIGLCRKPRETALAGTIISLAGMAVAASLIYGAISNQLHRQQVARQHARAIFQAQQIDQGNDLLESAAFELEGFRAEHEGTLPAAIDGNMLVIKYQDPWGQELRYEPGTNQATIRSAGVDARFDTADDLTRNIEGETDYEPLLPVDR